MADLAMTVALAKALGGGGGVSPSILDAKVDKSAIKNAGIHDENISIITNGEFTVVTEDYGERGINKDVTSIGFSVRDTGSYYRVTYDGHEYITYPQIGLILNEWNEMTFCCIGNTELCPYIFDNTFNKNTDNVPFFIIDSGAQRVIFTETAGSHTVKIEYCHETHTLLPKSLVYDSGIIAPIHYTPRSFGKYSIGINHFGENASRSIALGYGNNIVGGNNNIVTGVRNEITGGDMSFVAGGWKNTINGSYCLATGLMNSIEAGNAFVSGSSNKVLANNGAIIGGRQNECAGRDSVIAGYYNRVKHSGQFVFGRYNAIDPSAANANTYGTYVEIVGNGDSNTRSDARTLDWSGNERLAGDIYVGCNNDSTGGTKLARISAPSNTSGEYILKASMSNGVPTYSWVAQQSGPLLVAWNTDDTPNTLSEYFQDIQYAMGHGGASVVKYEINGDNETGKYFHIIEVSTESRSGNTAGIVKISDGANVYTFETGNIEAYEPMELVTN